MTENEKKVDKDPSTLENRGGLWVKVERILILLLGALIIIPPVIDSLDKVHEQYGEAVALGETIGIFIGGIIGAPLAVLFVGLISKKIFKIKRWTSSILVGLVLISTIKGCNTFIQPKIDQNMFDLIAKSKMNDINLLRRQIGGTGISINCFDEFKPVKGRYGEDTNLFIASINHTQFSILSWAIEYSDGNEQTIAEVGERNLTAKFPNIVPKGIIGDKKSDKIDLNGKIWVRNRWPVKDSEVEEIQWLTHYNNRKTFNVLFVIPHQPVVLSGSVEKLVASIDIAEQK